MDILFDHNDNNNKLYIRMNNNHEDENIENDEE